MKLEIVFPLLNKFLIGLNNRLLFSFYCVIFFLNAGNYVLSAFGCKRAVVSSILATVLGYNIVNLSAIVKRLIINISPIHSDMVGELLANVQEPYLYL